jgi:uncharacterized protein (TIGR04255 family)
VPKRYQNPPVVEALFEVCFRGGQWDTTVPGLFYEKISDRFPKKSQVEDVQFELRVSRDAPEPKILQRVERSQFVRANGSGMVQISPALLVVNQLRPYTHFENWRPLALEMLGLYRQLVKPEGIERLGVRYINRVVIPKPVVRMEDYFRVYPHVPDDLGGAHGSFLLRFELPQSDPAHQMLVTFGSAPAEDPGGWAALLDLYDVLGLAEEPFDVVEKRLEEAHANIALAFEASVTDRARELFEEVR